MTEELNFFPIADLLEKVLCRIERICINFKLVLQNEVNLFAFSVCGFL